jgi:hypothetical protein
MPAPAAPPAQPLVLAEPPFYEAITQTDAKGRPHTENNDHSLQRGRPENIYIRIWHWHGEYHRLNGPAVVSRDFKEWWIGGRFLILYSEACGKHYMMRGEPGDWRVRGECSNIDAIRVIKAAAAKWEESNRSRL